MAERLRQHHCAALLTGTRLVASTASASLAIDSNARTATASIFQEFQLMNSFSCNHRSIRITDFLLRTFENELLCLTKGVRCMWGESSVNPSQCLTEVHWVRDLLVLCSYWSFVFCIFVNFARGLSSVLTPFKCNFWFTAFLLCFLLSASQTSSVPFYPLSAGFALVLSWVLRWELTLLTWDFPSFLL